MPQRRNARRPARPAAATRPVVTLTTDFGLTDAYVAAMKAGILAACPDVQLVDVSHLTPPQDILAAAINLERAVAAFGPGTIHLAVVDPGVGGPRRMMVAKIGGQLVVCPDNGLVSWAWRRRGPGEAWELTWRPSRRPSATFHGRDIMGPVAGMLAAGKPLRQLVGPRISPLLLPVAAAGPDERVGCIIAIDRFGNAMTSLPEEAALRRPAAQVRVGGRDLGPVRQSYSDVPRGRPLALIGSAGLLELAVREGSAARKLRLAVGQRVELR